MSDSLYMQSDKETQQEIRKAMLIEADRELRGLYPVADQRHAAARVMVDRALSKERKAHETHIIHA